MNVAVGDTVGSFEVLAVLGRGGMGEVFRARDTRLGRDVALKFLGVGWVSNPEARARFEREARAIAALTHPNIGALHDLGEHHGCPYLVMECVEGETLAARLSRGALTMAEAARIGSAIAEALASAHRLGIVHRDLKPANVMLTKSGIKLLDFGLAKMLRGDTSDASTAMRTEPHAVMGTLPYMAPEQLSGGPVDARTDIFAFGVVLFEMVSGRRPFGGASGAEITSAIMRDEPARVAPPALDRLIRRCLAKDADERWQSLLDVGAQLPWIADVSEPADSRQNRATLVAVTAAAILIAAALAWPRFVAQSSPMPSAATPAPPVHLSITLNRGQQFVMAGEPNLAISRDGAKIVFVGSRDDVPQLFLRRIEVAESTPIAGTRGATSPAFSPDGAWVAFAADGRLKKVALAGGDPITLGDALELQGADWRDDGTIVFAPTSGSGLWRVAADGGRPEAITNLDAGRETSHRFPQSLPGDRILYTAGAGLSSSLQFVDLKTRRPRLLIEGAYWGRFVGPELLLFGRARQMFLQHMTPDGVPTADPPVAVGAEPFMTGSGAPFLAVSPSGTLVFLPAEADPSRRSLVWVDRSGRSVPLAMPLRPYQNPRIGPDGRRIATGIADGANRDLWIVDLGRGTLTPQTTDGKSFGVSAWSPDGRSLLFTSRRDGPTSIYRIEAEGTGQVSRLTTSMQSHWPGTWLADGKASVMFFSTGTLGEIGLLDLSTKEVRPVVSMPGTQWGARVSADGRWLAYVSNESGRYEAFVTKLDDPSRRWQVSDGGGHEVVWSVTGLELFFRRERTMMAVTINPAGDPPVGPARKIFDGSYLFEPSAPGLANYDVAPDGRFLMIARDDAADALNANVVLNWVQSIARPQSTRTIVQ